MKHDLIKMEATEISMKIKIGWKKMDGWNENSSTLNHNHIVISFICHGIHETAQLILCKSTCNSLKVNLIHPVF